jgi:hypothetical protein
VAVSSEFGTMLASSSWPALWNGKNFVADGVGNDDTGKGDEESVASAEIQIVDQVVLWEENVLVRKNSNRRQ